MGSPFLSHITFDTLLSLKSSDKEVVQQKSTVPKTSFSSLFFELLGDKSLDIVPKNNKFSKFIPKGEDKVKIKEQKEILKSDRDEKPYTEISIEELLSFSKLLSKNENIVEKFPAISKKLQDIISNKQSLKEFKNAKTIRELISVAKKHDIKIKSFEIKQIKNEALDKDIALFDTKSDIVKTAGVKRNKDKNTFLPASKEILTTILDNSSKSKEIKHQKSKDVKVSVLGDILKTSDRRVSKKHLQNLSKSKTIPKEKPQPHKEQYHKEIKKQSIEKIAVKSEQKDIIKDIEKNKEEIAPVKKDVKDIKSQKEHKKEIFVMPKVRENSIEKSRPQKYEKTTLNETKPIEKESKRVDLKNHVIKKQKAKVKRDDFQNSGDLFKKIQTIKNNLIKEKTEISKLQSPNQKPKRKSSIKTDNPLSHISKEESLNKQIKEPTLEPLKEEIRKIEKDRKKERINITDKSIKKSKNNFKLFSAALFNTSSVEETKEIKRGQKMEIGEEIEENMGKIESQNGHILQREEVISKKTQIPVHKTLSFFADDFKEAVQNYKPPITKIKMTLNPKNLGEVEVTLVHRGENLHVTINSNPNTIALFSQNHTEFKNALSNIGFSNLQMSFSHQQQQERQNQNPYKTIYKYDKEKEEEKEQQNFINFIVPRYI